MRNIKDEIKCEMERLEFVRSEQLENAGCKDASYLQKHSKEKEIYDMAFVIKMKLSVLYSRIVEIETLFDEINNQKIC